MGFGWKSGYSTGVGKDAITGGPEVTWTQTPTKWSNYFFENLFGYEWELTKSPAGAYQWKAKTDDKPIPDAFDKKKRQTPTMLTTDLSLRVDPIYEKISRRFLKNPDEFADAFARAWFKLTHRDMGPRSRVISAQRFRRKKLIWQDPVPDVDHKLIGPKDIESLKKKILATKLTTAELVSTAWASASTFRGSDKRGGANGARIRLAPMKDWEETSRPNWPRSCETLAGIQREFNKTAKGGKKVSLADLIVLARFGGHGTGGEGCRS